MPHLEPGSGAIAGVGRIPNGWIAAVETPDGSTHLELLCSLDQLLASADLAVIDIRIGLPDARFRTCDREARRRVGKRRSSVFPAPLRGMCTAPNYATACQISSSARGTLCSAQLHAVLPKVREADELLTPALQSRVREGHREWSFALLNGGEPLESHKSRPEGRAQRRALIEAKFAVATEAMQRLTQGHLIEDALDAYALLWSASRLRAGEHVAIPDSPQFDSRGLRAEMVA